LLTDSQKGDELAECNQQEKEVEEEFELVVEDQRDEGAE
jgi:hypothetical protein